MVGTAPIGPQEQQRIRIALLNDFDIVVAGLVAMLEPYPDLEVVDTSVGTMDVATPVDVALFDTYGRAGVPWDDIRELLAEPRARAVVLFTFSFSPPIVERALAEGVRGYLWKGLSRDGLADAIRRVAAGETVVSAPRGGPTAEDGYRWPFAELGLSARESEVLALLAEGMTNREIAAAMYVGVETVKSHVRAVFRKLAVRNRAEATARALGDRTFARQIRSLREQHDQGRNVTGALGTK